MYAIIKTGGKQYKVQAGDVLQIEKVEQELGSEFKISDILMIGGEKAHVGTPLVKNATVTAVVTKQARTKKVIVFKKKRRQGYRKFATHKQDFTEIFVKAITSPDGQTSKSDETPVVKDMAKLREERIQQKVADHKARVSVRSADVEAAPASKKPAKKAATKKKATKKAAAKKAPSKRSVKTAAKKATKKTAKKTK
ncbi:50S ribosomal protein L21 [Pseudobdellovibrio exovorus]|uniref:Large ribosomal subunit protein bL21 n=1 Tax=Pseudobdellovibrio exovorus JSS TaxID=1184267 RepID=M4VU56_9BACT|nr:50S ribosomal protein L21 [Pseudobdellovibrio exovorus]AGH96749.1 50S ribosomal protein L21 [Pseudobdellovibrio exovorus JSS]